MAAVSPRRIGHKALAVNLSDLAAMAAKPVAAIVSLLLPRHGALELAQEIYEGLLPLATRYNVCIAGGDTNCWDGPLALSITAIGEVAAEANSSNVHLNVVPARSAAAALLPATALLRSGAQAGRPYSVTGEFGGSILGKHLDFEPRVREAILLATTLFAACRFGL